MVITKSQKRRIHVGAQKSLIHDYHTGGIENIITYLQDASCRQDMWEILIMEGRIYDSRMNEWKSYRFSTQQVDFKKYKRRIANHHAKLILSNTCISEC